MRLKYTVYTCTGTRVPTLVGMIYTVNLYFPFHATGGMGLPMFVWVDRSVAIPTWTSARVRTRVQWTHQYKYTCTYKF